MSEKNYYVKIVDEESGVEYLVIGVPEEIPEKEILQKIAMAAKYASLHDLEYAVEHPDEYDEYAKQILSVFEDLGCDSFSVFCYYIESICNWSRKYLIPDFEFEW